MVVALVSAAEIRAVRGALAARKDQMRVMHKRTVDAMLYRIRYVVFVKSIVKHAALVIRLKIVYVICTYRHYCVSTQAPRCVHT